MKEDNTPDYLKMVDDSYKEQQQELAKQEKAAKYKQYGAIFADMANLAGDAMKVKSGLNVNARTANYSDEAMKRREAYTQARGAMKAQYAKDRMAAHAAQRRDALQQQQLAAQDAYRKQQQDNWQKTFDAGQEWKEKEHNLKQAEINNSKAYKDKMLEIEGLRAGKDEVNHTLFAEAINTDPELRAALETVDITNGVTKNAYSASDSAKRSVVAEYLRRKSNGKYNKPEAELGGVYEPGTLVSVPGTESAKGELPKRMSWVKNKNMDW